MPDGKPLAPDSPPNELVDKDTTSRNAQSVWVVPAPAGGAYTLRLSDLDRYSQQPHGSADAKLRVPSN